MDEGLERIGGRSDETSGNDSAKRFHPLLDKKHVPGFQFNDEEDDSDVPVMKKVGKGKGKAVSKKGKKKKAESENEEDTFGTEEERTAIQSRIKEACKTLDIKPPRFSQRQTLAVLEALEEQYELKMRIHGSFGFYKHMMSRGSKAIEDFTSNLNILGFQPQFQGAHKVFASPNPHLDPLLKKYLEEQHPKFEMSTFSQLIVAILLIFHGVHDMNTNPETRAMLEKLAEKQRAAASTSK